MIKINLLPTKAAKKKSTGGGSSFLLFALILLAAEGVALYGWYDGAKGEVAQARSVSKRLETKVQKLQKVKQEIAAAEEKRRLVEEQNNILQQLQDGKLGPPNMLLFLSYVLTKPADTNANQPELKALEKAGWNLQWDPDSVWVDSVSEDDFGTLTIEGEARSHEDVAEFFRRLRSSTYFRNVQPGSQERKYEQGIEMPYVAFEGTADLNYHLPAPKAAEEIAAEPGAGAKPAAAEPGAGVKPAAAEPGAGAKPAVDEPGAKKAPAGAPGTK